jgi:methanethiol S-methyltransferase
MSDYLFLALFWAAYCAVHSLLISIPVTSWLRAVLAGRYRFWRLFFNAFSIGTLVPLVMYSNSAPFHSEPLLVWSGYWMVLRYGLASLGVALFVAGARHYSLLQFLGIQQLRTESARSAMTGSGDLDNRGVLGLMRHPWYVAVFILLWTSELNAAAIMVNLVLSAYLVVGTLLEERKLVSEFGEEYRRYQDHVSMFIPLKWLTKKRSA